MIAIVPARGGSKGIPKKNIKLLAGKPLIAHVIETLRAAESIEEVFVSTDDAEIAEVAIKYGAKVPFLRPAELAQDNSKAIDAYLYTVERLNREYGHDIRDFLVSLPTSPFVTSKDINDSVELFRSKKAHSLISVLEMGHHPAFAKKMEHKSYLSNYFDLNVENMNRQELPSAYMPNGAIYIFQYNILHSKRAYYTEETLGYVMPPERSVDIDTLWDWEFAEFLINKNK